MAKYRFKAKDLITREWVEGDLVHVTQLVFKKERGVEYRERPMIVKLYSHRGMIYATERYFIDENTVELIKEM